MNHGLVTNFDAANMSFNAIPENNILAKISEFTVCMQQALSISPSSHQQASANVDLRMGLFINCEKCDSAQIRDIGNENRHQKPTAA